MAACDISETAIQKAGQRARAYLLQIAFSVANMLQDRSVPPRCNIGFEPGVLHTFIKR